MRSNAVNRLLIAAGGVMIIAELILGAVTGFDLLLVTANAREFGRVKGLVWEDWAKR